MFNPQRKSKVSDIFMQEKQYKLHLAKMNQIQRGQSCRNKVREEEENQQKRYLNKLEKSKKEIRERISSEIKRQNTRLLSKLVETDHRTSLDPEKDLPSRKEHFNNYFSTKKEKERVYHQNYTMVMRMDKTKANIPSLKDLKHEFKQNRRYKKNCRKLPSIVKYEEQFRKKQKLSSPLLQSQTHSKSKDLITIQND